MSLGAAWGESQASEQLRRMASRSVALRQARPVRYSGRPGHEKTQLLDGSELRRARPAAAPFTALRGCSGVTTRSSAPGIEHLHRCPAAGEIYGVSPS